MAINKISSSALNNGLSKINRKKSDVSSFKKTGASIEKQDSVKFSSLADKFDFSTELNKKITEVADDIRKQASIERKNEIKAQVRSGQYVVDAKALAEKLDFSDFDAKI